MHMESRERGRARTATIATFAVQLMCFFLYIICYSAPWWYVEELGDLKSSGLWMICTWGNERLYWGCTYLKDYKDLSGRYDDNKYTVCRVFMSIGLIAYIASMVLYIISFQNGRITSRIPAGVATGAGVMALITVGIYGDIYDFEERFYGWCFILSVVVGCVAVLAGVAGLVTGGDASKGPRRHAPQEKAQMDHWDAPSVEHHSKPLELSRHLQPKQDRSRGRTSSSRSGNFEMSFDDRPI